MVLPPCHLPNWGAQYARWCPTEVLPEDVEVEQVVKEFIQNRTSQTNVTTVVQLREEAHTWVRKLP